jgi:hypothetical protein
METYSEALDYLKFEAGDDLELKLDAVLKNKSKYYANVTKYRAIGAERFLEREENIGCHLELLNTPYNSPNRNFLKKYN